MTNDFDRLLKIAAAQAVEAGVPISDKIQKHIQINRRAKKRFGMCINKNGVFTIELSEMLLEAPERSCMQTIAHELIHTCDGCDNHGELFRKYADIMNRRYGYDIRRTNTAEEMGIEPAKVQGNVKYIIECQSCKTKIFRTRYSNVAAHPSRYRCRCGGILKRIK